MTKQKKDCDHMNFMANVEVARLEPSKIGGTMRFSADVTIHCTECGVPFRFIGLPAGVDLNGAATSVNGEEARLAIAPRGQVGNLLDGDDIVGFTVRRER